MRKMVWKLKSYTQLRKQQPKTGGCLSQLFMNRGVNSWDMQTFREINTKREKQSKLEKEK